MKYREGKEIKVTKRANGSRRVQSINDEPSLTQQHHKDSTDVNLIIAKYKQTGIMPEMRKKGVYADVSEITDYHQMVEKVMAADAAFMTLPASVRERFSNDPAQLLNFLQDPRNYDEGVKMGLYEPKIPQNNSQHANTNDLNEQNAHAKKHSGKKSGEQSKSQKHDSTGEAGE